MAKARRWALEAARELLPDVRERTERAVKQVEALLAEGGAAQGNRVAPEVEERVRDAVSRWAREMEALGLDVKGIWLVDFDTGAGYYCWRWPEEELDWFHDYESGFAGRVRIQ